MSIEKSPLQFKRGTTAKASAYTGRAGEPVVSIDTSTVMVDEVETEVVTNVSLSIHDGKTAGGWPLVKKQEFDPVSTLATATATATVNAEGEISSEYTDSAVDANELIEAGTYFCTSCTTDLHWPTTGDFIAKVTKLNSSSTIIQEIYKADSSFIRYKRTYSNSTWSAWSESADRTMGSILQAVYPVGAVYISATSTSPATVFGFGTWEAIEGKFLLSADTNHTAGTTGGSFSHTITTSEMPSHTHTISATDSYTLDSYTDEENITEASSESYSPILGKSISTTSSVANADQTTTVESASSYTASNTGGGSAMDITPPYLSVYMWKRTA